MDRIEIKKKKVERELTHKWKEGIILYEVLVAENLFFIILPGIDFFSRIINGKLVFTFCFIQDYFISIKSQPICFCNQLLLCSASLCKLIAHSHWWKLVLLIANGMRKQNENKNVNACELTQNEDVTINNKLCFNNWFPAFTSNETFLVVVAMKLPKNSPSLHLFRVTSQWNTLWLTNKGSSSRKKSLQIRNWTGVWTFLIILNR